MIECFCVPTANGQKATILLEELELEYEITRVDLRKGEHLSPEYLAMNPVGRAPTIIDRAGPRGEPLEHTVPDFLVGGVQGGSAYQQQQARHSSKSGHSAFS